MSTGAVGAFSLLVLVIVMVGVVAGVVAVTMAARRVLIQIPQRTMARGRMREASRSFIPLRINSSGVMPIVFAQSVIVDPGRGRAVHRATSGCAISRTISLRARRSTTSFEAILILFFTYFYTSIIFNPVDLAENLKKQGGFIPGVKPGAKTAEYIDDVVSKITLPGAVFLTRGGAAADLDLDDLLNVPFNFGGTSLLIVVGVALDTIAADEPAPAAAEVRRLHEEGPRSGSAVVRARRVRRSSVRRPVRVVGARRMRRALCFSGSARTASPQRDAETQRKRGDYARSY